MQKKVFEFSRVGAVLFSVIIVMIITFVFMEIPPFKSKINAKPYNKNKVINYTYYYGKSEFNDTFLFNENWFYKDNKTYNNNLAYASLCLSLCSSSYGDMSKSWGDKNAQREENIKKVLTKIGFKNQKFYNYDKSLNDTTSKSAFSISSKDISNGTQDGELVLVCIRSGNYGGEWRDNFNVGKNNEYHEGFYESSKNIKKELDSYIKTYLSNTKIKLWICGYSRGGALTNILAHLYSEDISLTDDIYAYSFATPNTYYSGFENDETRYIFNILNPYDVVTKIPPEKWNFKRFGTDLYFPKKTDENKNDEIFLKVSDTYKSIKGKDEDLFSKSFIEVILDLVLSKVKDKDAYSETYEKVFTDITEYLMTKKEENGKWVNYEFFEYFKNKHGKKFENAFNLIKNKNEVKILESVDTSLSKSLIMTDALCAIYNCEPLCEIITNNLTVKNISQNVNTLTVPSVDDYFLCHDPILYISWMKNITFENFTRE